jgi:hypothetical protein
MMPSDTSGGPGSRLAHPGSHLSRYHTDRQPGVADLVYVLLVVVAASIGAAAGAGRLALVPVSYGGGTACMSRRGPRRPVSALILVIAGLAIAVIGGWLLVRTGQAVTA